MKVLKLLVCILLISMLFSASPAAAQEPPPPEEETQEIAIEGELDLSALEGLGVDIKFEDAPQINTWDAPAPDLRETKLPETLAIMEEPQTPFEGLLDVEPLPEEIPAHPLPSGEGIDLTPPGFERDDVDPLIDESNRVVYPESGLIGVAITTTYDEYDPDIAHGGGYYMIVYTYSGNVHARVYDNNGKFYTGGLVYDGYRDCSRPTIAYDAFKRIFVVAFEYDYGGTDTDYDIYAIAVSPHIGPLGSVSGISQAIGMEDDPSIACNTRISTGGCLVAFEYPSGNPIHGKFIYTNSGGISSYSATPYPLDVHDGYKPYLAFGKGTGTYLLTYDYYYGTYSAYFPIYNHIYDVYVSGNQYVHTGFYPSYTGMSLYQPKYTIAAAYDPCMQKYLLMWRYYDSTYEYDIRVHVISPTSSSTYGSGWLIADYESSYAGDIAFVTDSHAAPVCGPGDRFVATYKNSGDGVYVTDIWGNHSISSPIYYWNGSASHYEAAPDMSGLTGYDPMIASGARGKVMLTWNWLFSSTSDWDVWARMIRVFWTDFLPIMAK